MLFVALVTAASVLAVLALRPKLIAILLSPFFRAAGWHLRNKTTLQRQRLRKQVRLDEDIYNAEGNLKPTNHYGDGWNGIVGFFHPFWYAAPFIDMTATTLEIHVDGGDMNLATQVVVANVYSGPQ